ncbi:MAG: TolC family protein [Planctomycetaceae bacterium]|nr:TolC family protein [Planctomycetaceae bacterium]
MRCHAGNAIGGLTLTILSLAVAGCGHKWWVSQADKSAYGAVDTAQKRALGEKKDFDIAYDPYTQDKGGQIALDGKAAGPAQPKPRQLTVDESLQIAFRNSRNLQTRKEQLYVDALGVASSRRSWDYPLLAGSIDGSASETRIGEGSTTEAGALGIGPTLTQRLMTGGVVVAAASLDLATDFLGTKGTPIGSLLNLNVTQPLLRGAWNGVAYEPQYRLERNLLINVFSYARFRQTFAASIVQQYYSVLQRRDQAENEIENISRLENTVAVTRVLVEGGQVSRIQLDQAEQNLLNAQVRYQQLRQSYQDALDAFKVTLGLPALTNVELDYPGALEALVKTGTPAVGLKEEDAIAVALAARPDVAVQRAAYRDAQRDVTLAADNFLPQLDVEVDLSATGTEPRKFQRIQWNRRTMVNSMTLHYDIDQVPNRDVYRVAVIAMDQAQRSLAEFEDQVRVQVRGAYRALLQNKRSYDLQVRNVEIARRRRTLAALQQREGQASARDVLEAEDALRSAQDGLTSALVSYTTTRLNFLAGLGLLSVDEKGQIHERKEPFRFDLLRQRYDYLGQ